ALHREVPGARTRRVGGAGVGGVRGGRDPDGPDRDRLGRLAQRQAAQVHAAVVSVGVRRRDADRGAARVGGSHGGDAGGVLDGHRAGAAAAVLIDGTHQLGDRECGRARDSGDGGGGEYFHDTYTRGCAVADDDRGDIGCDVADEG